MERFGFDHFSSCAGKQGFPTAAKAVKASKSMAKERRRAGLQPYRCDHCHQFHLGNGKPLMTNKDKKNGRRKLDRYLGAERQKFEADLAASRARIYSST